MPRWPVPTVGLCLALAVAACAAPLERWAHSAGTDHPLTGQIYRVADGAVVSALQRDPRQSRALAFGTIGVDRQLAIVEYLDRHPGDAAGLGAALDRTAGGWPEWA